MAAARYWRIVGVQAVAGGDLELSELHLYGPSGRVDAGATITSSHAPTVGTLAALADGSTATGCTFARDAVRAAGFYVMWSFASDTEVFGVRPGSGASKDKYLERLHLQYLDTTGAWVTAFAFGKFQWPGSQAMDIAPATSDPYLPSVSALLPMNGTAGSTTFTDVKGNVWTPAGGAQISTAHSFFGSGVGVFSGGQRITTPHSAALALDTGDFTIEFLVRFTSSGANHVIVNKGTATGLFAYQVWVDSAGQFGFRGFDAGGSLVYNISGGAMAVATDYFISARRSGSTFTLHVNDTLIGSATYAGNLLSASADPLSIGAYSNGIAGLYGYLGQFRITPGVARPTTVPTGPWPTSAGAGQAFDPLSIRTAPVRASIAASSPVPAFSTRRTAPLQLARDVEVGGPGTIYGTTKTKGTPNVPTKARVVLLCQRSKLPVRETWSDPVTGNFAFPGIDTTQQFLTLAEDAAGNFRPVAANRLTPEVLP